MNKAVKKKNPGHKKLYIFSGIVVLFLLFLWYVVSGLPGLEELENPDPHFATKVYSVDGELVGQFYIENRIETDIDSLPKHLIEALIATEDRKFYDHWGVDLDRFVKAMVKNIFTFSREGASTITQQLAKNLYQLKGAKENLFDTGVRKLREWFTAIQIERTFTKKEILELYLNISYFGKGAYGVETAAQIYFNKKADELTVPESALLIALLKSSVFYDPEKRPERAKQRRNIVMYNMVQQEVLSSSEYEKFKREPIVLARGQKVNLKTVAPHFLEYIRQEMQQLIADKRISADLYRDGLTIYTTLDYQMQLIANKVSKEHLAEYQALFNKNWKWEKNNALLKSLVERAARNSNLYRSAETDSEKQRVLNLLKNDPEFVDSVKIAEATVQVGFVVTDQSSGEIRAMVGGENQDFLYGLNHVTQIRRQPGSSFKPIVYAVAVDNGCSPEQLFENQIFEYEGWSPRNSDGEYGDFMTLREALARSVNVIAGRLTTSDYAPPKQVVQLAKDMGINSELRAFPSIALGTSEITPLELAGAYGTIANGGIYMKPFSILRVEDRNGIVIYETRPQKKNVLSPRTAAIVVDMMQDVVNWGTGAGARRYFHRPAAGKTGTTQAYSDAWFGGFTPQLLGVVWVGFDDHRVKFSGWYGQGAKAAMPIWAKFMAETYKTLNLPLKYFDIPSGVAYAEFCKYAVSQGVPALANETCPEVISDIIDTENPPEQCIFHPGPPRRPGGQADTQNKNTSGGSGW